MTVVSLLAVAATSQAAQLPDSPKLPPPHVQDLQVPARVTLPPLSSPLPFQFNWPLTADEAARIALRHQPALDAALGAKLNAHGRTTYLQAGLLPQIGAGLGYDKLESFSGYGVQPTQSPFNFALPTVSPVDAFMAGVQAKQLIYDFNQTRNLVRQSQFFERVANDSLTQTQLNVVVSVKAAYINYAYAERLVLVNEQNVANRQRQYDLANERMKDGVGLPSDVVNALTSKSQGILALNVARDNAEQARVTLLLQMGINPLTPVELPQYGESSLDVPDPQALLKVAMKKRPEVLAAQDNVTAAKYGLSASRAVNAPTLYAGLASGTRGNQTPLNDSTFSFQVGLQIPLFDGGQRRGAVQESKGQLESAQAQLQSTVLSVQGDVTGAYLSVKSAEQRVMIADNEVFNAREAVRIAEGRYASGLGLFLDITNAQALLLGALTDQTAAHNALEIARNRVRYATGEALDPFVDAPVGSMGK